MRCLACTLVLGLTPAVTAADGGGEFNPATIDHYAEMALAAIHREYPNKIAHVLNSADDVKPPRELTPVFFGCFDWHSAVHGHWLLVRLCRLYPEHDFVPKARALLDQSFTAKNVSGEVAYLAAENRASFERPYGLAWLLQLCAELHEWDDDQARKWAAALTPLERVAADRFRTWFPKLTYPNRTGEHSQTAFALGLIYDWARTRGDAETVTLAAGWAKRLYATDRGANLAFEPDGQAFLSPILAEADLMRRIMPPAEFAAWLDQFLPDLPRDAAAEWLPVAVVTDRTDGKLVHLDGLNLSRAWMLDGITSGLPPGDRRIPVLAAAARRHRSAGLAAVTGDHYAGGHWLATFAVYLVTQRGLLKGTEK